MSNICVLLGFDPQKSHNKIEDYFKLQTREYGIGLFVGKTNIVDNYVKDNTFVCSFADDNEYDNCEMLLLPDNCYHNGYTNLIPFRARMIGLSRIIEGSLDYFSRIELFVGDVGASMIEEFEPCSISVKQFAEFMDINFNNYNFPAFHLTLSHNNSDDGSFSS